MHYLASYYSDIIDKYKKMSDRPYDLVVYGASGFTGQFVAVEAVRSCKGKRIAIAGRTKSKLEDVLKRIEKDLGMIKICF